MIFSLGHRKTAIDGDDYFIAHNATVIGSVVIKNNASIWFNSVIRGDMACITIGAGSNIQDSCVLHTDEGIELTIGEMVTVGHNAVLHGCAIGDKTLIGINAVILNGAKIGSNCIIGAGALITENTEIPDNSLVMGVPGKIIRNVRESETQQIMEGSSHYIENFKHYKKYLKEEQ